MDSLMKSLHCIEPQLSSVDRNSPRFCVTASNYYTLTIFEGIQSINCVFYFRMQIPHHPPASWRFPPSTGLSLPEDCLQSVGELLDNFVHWVETYSVSLLVLLPHSLQLRN